MTDLAASRRRMVQDQVQGRGVRDARLLEAMERVARERVVPSEERPPVFENQPIPVAEGVVLPQAQITAYRIEALALAPGARVLPVGVGTGCEPAVMAAMDADVFTLEPDGPTSEHTGLLADPGHDRVHVRPDADLRAWEEKAPFDAILLRGAVAAPRPELFHPLARGGRMVATIGRHRPAQELVRDTSDAQGRIDREDLADIRLVPPRDLETGEERAGPAPARVIERLRASEQLLPRGRAKEQLLVGHPPCSRHRCRHVSAAGLAPQ